MIVLIYGVQRSGKTTLIKRLLNYYGNDAVHIKRNKIQDELSIKLFGKADNGSLTLNQQNKLYELSLQQILKYNSKYRYVFLDYHAGYLLKDKTLLDFRPDSYHKIGDVYFYLKTNPRKIYERMLDTNGLKSVYDFSIEDIALYQVKEIQKLKHIIEKELNIVGCSRDPLYEIVSILGEKEFSSNNRIAWDFKTYDYWLKRYGTPDVMARNLYNGKDNIFQKYYPYIGDIKGKKIACVCDSCGRLANSLVLNGAHVTVFDYSTSGKKYASECADCLQQKLEYINVDLSKKIETCGNKFDMVISTVGVLHYFLDINIFMENVASLLKDNGVYILHDFHPFLKLVDNKSLAVQINDDYFYSSPFYGYMPYNFERSEKYPKCLYREYMLKDIFSSLLTKFNISLFDELRYHEEKYPTSFVIKAIKRR